MPVASLPESQRLRLVLVGLGVDDKSRRIVSFLVESDLDISLVTFHAFEEQGKIYLAKQVEVQARSPEGPTSATKAGNLEKLRERVEKLGLSDFYYDAAALPSTAPLSLRMAESVRLLILLAYSNRNRT